MGFQGADTTALREQARAVRECGKVMLEHSSTLTSAVMSVAWVGPDADEMRRRWTEVDEQIRSSAQALSARAKELAEHAEEQDNASQGDSGEGGSLWDRLGLPSLSDLFTNAGSRLSDAVGWARKLADAVAPGGPGGDNPLLAAMDPGSDRRGAGSADPGDISDWIGDLFGGGSSPEEDSPFTHQPGEDSTKHSGSVTGPKGDSAKVTKSEDSVTLELTDAHQRELTVGNRTLTIAKDHSYSVEVLSDGTKVFTFTETSSVGEEHKSDVKIADLTQGNKNSNSVTYSVTAPPGADLEDVVGISPYDPDSIPPGYELAIDTSEQSSTSVDGGVDLKRLPPLRFGADVSDGSGTTTQIARDEDGTLSVKAGPTESESKGAHMGVGNKDLNFTASDSRDKSGAQLEYAEFADTEAGNKAFSEAVRTGTLPDADSSAVTERYSETRSETTSERGLKFHAEKAGINIDIERQSTTFASERITRQYSDGRTEWNEQVLPLGPDTGSYARASGGSDQETSYEIRLNPKKDDDMSVVSHHYGRDVDGPYEIRFTESELNRARGNAGSPDSHTNLDYASELVAGADRNGSHSAIENLYNDYNNARPTAEGGTPSQDPIPGRLE